MIRLFTFTAAFVLGTLFTFVPAIPDSSSQADRADIRWALAKTSASIEVEYLGWSIEDDHPRLNFQITNGLDNTLSYFAHQPESMFSVVTRNGGRINPYHCGTGARDHYLAAGGSANTRISPYELGDRVKPSDRFTAGYYFKIGNMKEPVLITSEPFTLPEDYRTALKAYWAKWR